jgi:hypothetical protein
MVAPMRRARSRSVATAAAVLLGLALSGCGSTGILHHGQAGSAAAGVQPTTAASPAPLAGSDAGASAASATAAPKTSTPQQLGFPYVATKNTTRVAGDDPVSNAAGVALAVFPSEAAGTHPTAVTLAPTDDWEAALAASSLMGSPFRAPILLSTPTSLPTATASALDLLAPTGDPSAEEAQVIRVGNVPSVPGMKSTAIGGANPFAIAANIDAYEAKQRGGESTDVVIASADDPAAAMPAAGWIAESGEPLLFVSASGVPTATATQLMAHHHPKIYVLGPVGAVSASVFDALKKFGTVKRIDGKTPAAESVNFAAYRDPACPASGEQCAHIPHSFGWAIRSPGHGYVLLNENAPLDAAAASALSASGGYGPQLLVSAANTLPQAVLNYFLAYATPGYTSEGPTAAVYNHAWLIGSASEISGAVQAQVDSILEVEEVK